MSETNVEKDQCINVYDGDHHETENEYEGKNQNKELMELGDRLKQLEKRKEE